jgi:glutathione S-transferase
MSMLPHYKLFYSPGACSLAPHIVLEELGVTFDPVRVVIAEGENRTPTFLAINPRGRVPALQVDDDQGTRTITEAMAIMIYLAQRYPESGLLETAPESFARTLEWMSWLGSTLHQTGIRAVLRPERFTADSAGAPAIAARGHETVAVGYADLEQRLPREGYALGGQFTILDAYLLVFYRWGNRIGLDMRERFPRYSTLMDQVRARPAVQRVVAREGIDLGA